MTYRLRHQVNTPVPRTAAGISTIVSQNMNDEALAVSVRRRSDASRGLIEIRLSFCDSQLIVFMNRSRLPSIPRYAFSAKSESPIATTRVSGFDADSVDASVVFAAGFASGFSAAGAGVAVATAIETGPARSPFSV